MDKHIFLIVPIRETDFDIVKDYLTNQYNSIDITIQPDDNKPIASMKQVIANLFTSICDFDKTKEKLM